MLTGADKFKTLFEKHYRNRPILLYGDPDVDGLYSLYLMAKFVESQGITNYSHFVNEKRSHTWSIPVDKLKGYLVISADFTVPKEVMQELVDNDVVILATDHHEITDADTFIEVKSEKTEAEGIFISNQYNFEPEEDKYLSGAGVFYELVGSLYPSFQCQLHKALVGITLLSDIRKTNNEKAKDYLKTTYSMTSADSYVKYLLTNLKKSDRSFGEPKLTRNFIEFNLCPTVNALLRFDMLKEAIDFILGKGLADSSRHGAQKEIIEKTIEKNTGNDFGSFILLTISDAEFRYDFPYADPCNFIGVICNRLKEKAKKSVLGLVIKDGTVARASFRGLYSSVAYRKSFCNNLNINAAGHQAAFGIKDLDNILVDEQKRIDFLTTIDGIIADLESTFIESTDEAKPSIIEISNIALGSVPEMLRTMAYENIYLNQEYRKYVKYTGKNYIISSTTYKTRKLTKEELDIGVRPEIIKTNSVYVRNEKDEKIPVRIEYIIDGRTVASFGTKLEDGYIMPYIGNSGVEFFIVSI